MLTSGCNVLILKFSESVQFSAVSRAGFYLAADSFLANLSVFGS